MSAWGGILFVRSRHCGELNRGLQNLDSLFGKVLILLQRSRHCGERKRGLENLEKFQKDLILLVGRCYLGGLIRGLQNLESPCKGTGLFFSLVRKEPKVPQRFANLWTPGTIQSSAGNNLGEVSGGTSRNRFFAQNGGEKALNRCDVRALQRKDLERRLKEKPCSLVDSRLWLGGNGRWRAKKGCLGWK